MSRHDFGPLEMEMARGGRVESLRASLLEHSMGRGENELLGFSLSGVSGLFLFGFGCGKEILERCEWPTAGLPQGGMKTV
jgi:hypothetical protein